MLKESNLNMHKPHTIYEKQTKKIKPAASIRSFLVLIYQSEVPSIASFVIEC